ncbi:MAG TPA: phosphatase PAP2 family protein [Bacteroidales bacterium]|nr:phosphatase PAP2 family protein [Bacteroidales bacterium]
MFRILLLSFLLLTCSTQAQNIDVQILRSIHTSEPLPADPIFQFISDTHTFVVAGAPLAMGATALITHNDELLNQTIELGAASALNLGMTYLLKYSINRKRPYITYPDIMPKSSEGSPSFPSGHTSSSFATATSLSLMYPKWYVIAPSFIWAGSVGYSRIYLGVHYPSDVMAGALLGAGSAWLAHKANQWYQSKQNLKHGKFE